MHLRTAIKSILFGVALTLHGSSAEFPTDLKTQWGLIEASVPDSLYMPFQPPVRESETIKRLAKAAIAVSSHAVSEEQVKNSWKKVGKTGTPSGEQAKVIRDYLRSSAFLSENAEDINRVCKAGYKDMFDALAANRQIGDPSRVHAVFVPLACPSKEVYQQTREFLFKACERAKAEKAVILVSISTYGAHPPKMNDYWKADAEKLRIDLSPYVTQNVVRILNAPFRTSTPAAYFYGPKGEIRQWGNMARMSEKPQAYLDALALTYRDAAKK